MVDEPIVLMPPAQPVRKGFRWEVVTAGLAFVFFWADVTSLHASRSLPPGDRYRLLCYEIPWFVFIPGLLVSVLRNPRANALAKWSAGGMLVAYLASDVFQYTAHTIFRAVALLWA